MSLMAGAFFIAFGFMSIRCPPSINNMIGYNSPLAMKNQDTWDVAQKHSGFILIIFGVTNGILGIWLIIQPMTINKKNMQLLLVILSAVAIVAIEEIHPYETVSYGWKQKKAE